MLSVAAIVAVAVICQVALRRSSRADWIDDARPEGSCLMISQHYPVDAAPGPVGTVHWAGGPDRKVMFR